MIGTAWPQRRQPQKRIGALAVVLALAGCGGSQATTVPVPADPATTIQAFMHAVAASDLNAMAKLWGSSRGPASTYMATSELEQRLTVIRIYLQHERYEIVPTVAGAGGSSRERQVSVRITRHGCTPVVPITLVRYRDDWLIGSIDLAAVGNPARSCVPTPEPSR